MFQTCSDDDEQWITFTCPSGRNIPAPREHVRTQGCVRLAISFFIECDAKSNSTLFFISRISFEIVPQKLYCGLFAKKYICTVKPHQIRSFNLNGEIIEKKYSRGSEIYSVL